MKKLLSGLAAVVFVALGIACDSVTPVAPADGVLTISVNPARIDSTGEAIVTVLARKVDGFPVNPGTEINLTTDVGLIETPVYTNDRGIAEAILQGNGDVGIATVTASSGSLDSAEITLQVGSLPFDISLRATPAEISIRTVPPGGYVISLRATVIDDLGAPLRGVAVLFDTELGKLESKGKIITTNQNGVAKDTLTVKKNNLQSLAGNFFIVSVSTGGDPDMDFTAEIISVDEEVSVVGFPSDIFLESAPSSIPATGGEITLTATVRDELGEPLEGVGVQFASEVGSSSSRGAIINTNINGQAFDTVTASQEDIQAFTGNAFTVEARVPDAPGAALLTDTELISIQGLPPLAGFTFEACGNVVVFTNTTAPMSTADLPVEFLWDFGDGTTSEETSPTKVYAGALPQTVFVTLMATNLFGADLTDPVAIDLTDPTPVPSFTTMGEATGSLPRLVTFDASSTMPEEPATYRWNFDDPPGTTGNPNTATGVVASHTFALADTYKVSLTVTACVDRESESVVQIVQDVVIPP